MLWAWFTDVRLKNKHIPLSLRLQARLAKPPQSSRFTSEAVLFMKNRPYEHGFLAKMCSNCQVKNKAWPCWTRTSRFTQKMNPFFSQIERWAYELTYSTLTRVTISQKSETFSPYITVQNNKYFKWPKKTDVELFRAKRRQPKREEGRERHHENTKVVQCRYLHLTQSLKTEVYLQTGGWSKPG